MHKAIVAFLVLAVAGLLASAPPASAQVGERSPEDDSHIYLGVQNLTDNATIVARRPAGVRPGLPRTFVAGIWFDFEQP